MNVNMSNMPNIKPSEYLVAEGVQRERERGNDCCSTEGTDPPCRAMIEAHKRDSTASCFVVRNLLSSLEERLAHRSQVRQ